MVTQDPTLTSGNKTAASVELSRMKRGDAGAQVVNSLASAPAHKLQVLWQALQVSIDVALPPVQTKPSSGTQAASHPSPASRLPSSHASAPTRRPAAAAKPVEDNKVKATATASRPESARKQTFHRNAAVNQTVGGGRGGSAGDAQSSNGTGILGSP